MSPELENQLYNIDPVFFKDAIACENKEKNEMDTCMYWGCECGDGWFIPIKKLIEKIHVLNQLCKNENLQIVCDQLKEKFGEFTCYFHVEFIDKSKPFNVGTSNTINNIVDDLMLKCEKECWNVCEICGTDKNLITTEGWIQRICKLCNEKGK